MVFDRLRLAQGTVAACLLDCLSRPKDTKKWYLRSKVGLGKKQGLCQDLDCLSLKKWYLPKKVGLGSGGCSRAGDRRTGQGKEVCHAHETFRPRQGQGKVRSGQGQVRARSGQGKAKESRILKIVNRTLTRKKF